MKHFGYKHLGFALALGVSLLIANLSPAPAADSTNTIDWSRARELLQKSRKGEKLSPEDSAYLEQAKAARRGPTQRTNSNVNPDMQRARELMEKRGRGGQLTPDEQQFLTQMRQKMATNRVGVAGPPPPRERTGLIPLNEMPASQKYKGEDGGLYGKGRNEPPDDLMKRAVARAAEVVPRDAAGAPAEEGKIGLLSIGMSNTTQEYSEFKRIADRDTGKDPHVIVVDGAQGGQDAAVWSDSNARAWSVLADRLKTAGVSSNQVQVIWMKHARITPSKYGEFPKHTAELEQHISASIKLAQQRFPNLKLVYLSSRIYAGYAVSPLNPEPFAYESAFAVRQVILNQLSGNEAPDQKGPVVLWGPYLWTDGTKARKSDGLAWKKEDCGPDGTHPSTSGREKVANLLLTFLKQNTTSKRWFVKR